MTKKLAILANVNASTIDFRNKAGPSNRQDYGGQVEAGYFLSPAWQLVARYSVTKLDHDFKVGNVGQFHEITAGVNWFLGEDGVAGNHAKLSLDATYLPKGTPAATGLDYLASPNGNEEIVLRAQFQLWF